MTLTDLKPLRVLVIEDCEDDAQLVLRALARSQYACEHRRVQTAAELGEALSAGPWDIIFSDHSMPGFSAPEALRIVRERGEDTPFVVVSGSIGDEQAVAVMRAGAHDYIIKDNLSRLGPVVDRELREAQGRARRLRAEASLRENEAMFRALSASSPLGIYMTDVQGRTTYVNPRACEIFQVPPAEALGNTWLQRLSPEDRPKAWANWKSYIEKGGVGEFSAEHRLRFPGRPDLWTRTRVSPVRNETGHVGFVGTVEDVTDYKTAELALLESEEYNRRLVQEARDIIFSINPDATIAGLNPAFVAVTGWQIDEWIGKPFLPLIHPEDIPTSMAKLLLVLGGGESPPYELRLKPKSGPYLVLEFTVTPRTREGSITGVNGIGRDVTQRKQLEAQLHQAQKVEAIGSLAGGIAHDFNNILSVILGYAGLALSELDPETTPYACVQEMNNAAERAAALTRQLLAFSRKQTLQPEVLDLNRTMLDLEKMLGRLIGENIDLQVVPGEGVKPVKADVAQIEQALMNLVINARDAISSAGGAITVETSRAVLTGREGAASPDLPPGEYSAFSVTDTGTGMPPEVLARLFEPFFTTKPEGKGTGLGLSTVHGIVRQSGGDIVVASEPGRGSVFTVYLPGVEETPVDKENRTGSPKDPRGTETVLVVEDEEPLRILAITVLKKFDYTVIDATDGEEALRIARNHPEPISLVVTDVVMPKMGGPRLATELRDSGYTGKILFVSGYTGGALAEQGVAQEKVHFLQKPFTPTSLARKVREVLDAD